jgi:serine phosphatase RsbU (regulator of sigma subunit)
MEFSRKKILLVAFTGLLLLASTVVVTWRITVWNKTGWVGMAFMPGKKSAGKTDVMLKGMGPGAVYLIFPGSPAHQAGMLRGDEVLEINGTPIYEETQLQALAATAMIGDTLIYRISRGEKELSLPLRLESPLKTQMIAIMLYTSIPVALISLMIGFFVHWKTPQDRRAFVFYLMSVVAAAYFFINSVAGPEQVNAIGLQRFTTIFLVYAVVIVLFSLLLLHLALVFPKERPVVKKHPYIFRWIYGLPLLMLSPIVLISGIAVLYQKLHNPDKSLLYNLGYSFGKLLGQLIHKFEPTKLIVEIIVAATLLAMITLLLSMYKKAARAEGWKQALISRPFTTMSAFTVIALLVTVICFMLFQVFHLPRIIGVILVLIAAAILMFSVFGLLGLLYPAATCAALLRSYRESGVEEKRQVQWPLWGTIVGVSGYVPLFVFLNYSFFNRDLASSIMIPGEILEKVFYLIIPLSFAFAIFKYRLMDIDLIIKKTIVYAIITSVIVALYLSLVGGLGGLLIKFTGVQSTWVTIFSTLAIAALFVPVRNRVQNVVDRRFFRKKYDYPTALKNLTRELSQAVELQAMLKLVTEHLQPALQNRSVVIFTRGTYDRAYLATAKVGLPDEILGQLKFELGSPLLTMMDSPFEVHTKDFPETEKLTLRKAGSAFFVPVKLKNELVGFISLGTKLSDEDYDAEDKDFLASVAEQMAAGFDRVRLREQERDFEKAREIQQGLLPKQIPQLLGYEIACAWQPARAVAGDYYDVIKLSESALGICIADVVGKGMPAALLMSNLQAIVRAMASEDMPPKQLCEKVNRVISSNMTPGKFITFFYCLLDAQNKKLVYTNAGHNRPILFRQDGSWMELKEGGLALGMSRERNYEQGEAELKSGDRLLLFTDGVTEVTNTEGQAFDEQRLIGLLEKNRELGAAELQKKVLEAVTQFSAGDFQDDVTLMAISVA